MTRLVRTLYRQCLRTARQLENDICSAESSPAVTYASSRLRERSEWWATHAASCTNSQNLDNARTSMVLASKANPTDIIRHTFRTVSPNALATEGGGDSVDGAFAALRELVTVREFILRARSSSFIPVTASPRSVHAEVTLDAIHSQLRVAEEVINE